MRKLLFVLMTAFASLDAGAQTFFTQGNLLFTVNEENPTTVSVKKAFSDIGGEIVIPSTVVNEGVAYTVTLITGNAFDNTSITSVTIPASVDSIGNRAFESCQSLTNIHIDDSDKELKLVSGFYGILYGANADKSVYVGRNLILSENSAPFPNATSVEFGDKVTAINKRLFYDANKLANVTIGKGVTEIGDAAFWNAGDDESVVEMTVTLGENVKTIGVSAFEDHRPDRPHYPSFRGQHRQQSLCRLQQPCQHPHPGVGSASASEEWLLRHLLWQRCRQDSVYRSHAEAQ